MEGRGLTAWRGINTLRVGITPLPFPRTTTYFRSGYKYTPQLIETTGRKPQCRKIFRLVRNVLHLNLKDRKRISLNVPTEERPWRKRRSK
jgi:hypothetical protein